MFTSPCILRSAQCAAIIALAAAAGLARLDPGKGQADPRSDSERPLCTPGSKPPHLEPRFILDLTCPFQLALTWRLLLVPTHNALPAVDRSGVDSPRNWATSPESPLLLPSLASRLIPRSPTDVDAAFVFAPHRLPWSVGPPVSRNSLTPSADRTSVRGDSAARSLFDLSAAPGRSASSS